MEIVHVPPKRHRVPFCVYQSSCECIRFAYGIIIISQL
jgi:hypothetical protein